MIAHHSVRPPSMMDVAAAAGVSHQTVSRVLNASAKVAPDTRQRVLDAIERLGYRRNSVARALVTRRSGTLGLITTTSTHYGPTSMLVSIELAASRAGYFLAVAPIDSCTPDTLGDAIDHMLGLAVEGIVILAPIEDIAEDLGTIRVSVPVVAVTSASTAESLGVVPVAVDQYEGARLAVEHLVSHGHTAITHLAGPSDWFEAQGREKAYCDVMARHGLTPCVYSTRGWEASVGFEVGAAIANGTLPTAIFAANDPLALGLINAFTSAGITVPGDVSVVGFDDEPGARYFMPPLTTVRQDFRGLGEAVVTVMMHALEGRAPDAPTLLTPELVVRASTAAPPLSAH